MTPSEKINHLHQSTYTAQNKSSLIHWGSPKRYFRIIIVLIFIFILLQIFTSLKQRFKEDRFFTEIKKCNTEEKNLRFTCFRYIIDKFYSHNTEKFINRIAGIDESIFASKDNSYAVFGTNCHTFYHAAGDFIAEESPDEDFKSNLKVCPSNCTSGCTMGLYKRTALQNNFDSNLLKRFMDECREGENHQCAHEIGHLLQDKYFYSILKNLDELAFKKYWLKTKTNYNYITFTQTDFNAPFEECKKAVPEKELPYCYTGIGHNLFLFSEFSTDGYKSMFSECDKIKKENRDNCYSFLIYRIGINEVGPRFLSKKYDEGNKICDDVISMIDRKDLKHHCYLGIGGGIGLFVDTQYLSTPIPDERLEQTKKELIDYAKLCENSEKDFENRCFAGIMGTRFKLIYKLLNIKYDRIEKILPTLNDDFEVVG